MIELLKSLLFGIVQGITEWLPVSSTGHMILLEELVKLNVSEAFWEMFLVVIQFGSILAVVVLYFLKLNPFSGKKSVEEKRDTWKLWLKVLIAVIPSAVFGLLLDDWIDAHFFNYITVAVALIVYGVAFILIERRRTGKHEVRTELEDIDYRTALMIGVFQILALIPGTSRSGSTILGAMLLGLAHKRRGILLLHGDPDDARRKRPEDPEIHDGRRLLRGAGNCHTACRRCNGLCRFPLCDQGADALCAQTFVLRLRRLPHRARHCRARVFHCQNLCAEIIKPIINQKGRNASFSGLFYHLGEHFEL